jgi:hypothetical protein
MCVEQILQIRTARVKTFDRAARTMGSADQTKAATDVSVPQPLIIPGNAHLGARSLSQFASDSVESGTRTKHRGLVECREASRDQSFCSVRPPNSWRAESELAICVPSKTYIRPLLIRSKALDCRLQIVKLSCLLHMVCLLRMLLPLVS